MSDRLGELWRRFRFLINRQQFESDLDEEIRLHKELRQQEYRSAGVDYDSARHKAQRQFGNDTLLKEVSREMWGWHWFETLAQDLRYAFRMLGRSPGFTAAAVLSLALGIGANTTVFTLINALLLRMLPVREPRQLVLLGRSSLETNDVHSFPYPFYRELRANNPAFSGVLCYTGMSPALNVNGNSERVSGELVSGNYFDVLGVKPYIGRLFTREDDKAPGAEHVAVLSHGFWARRFGGDPGIVGKVIRLNTVPMTVIGISPPRFDGLDIGQSADVRVPIAMQAEMWADRSLLESRGDWWLRLVARLKPGIARMHAEAAIQPLLMAYARTGMQANPTEYQRRLFASHRVVLDPMSRGEQNLGRQFGRSLYVLMAVVGVVLLIACVNIANLLLARSTAREREIAIRLALGSGRRRLIRQMLTESVVLAMIGGILGVAIAYWGSRILVSFLPPVNRMSPSFDLRPDLLVLGFTFAVSFLTGILFGLAPALKAVGVNISPSLKGGNAPAGTVRFMVGKLLVSIQVALSVLLLAGAGLFARSLHNLQTMDTGFDRENVVALRIDPTLSGYKQERVRQFYQDVLARVNALPGVRGASYAAMGLIDHSGWGSGIKMEGYTRPDGDPGPDRNTVGPSYFHTLGIPIVVGRDFGQQDNASSPHVAIVNEKFARFYFGGQSPIGRRIGPEGDKKAPDFAIVGVVKDGKYASMRQETPRFWYIPYEQQPEVHDLTLYVRLAGNAQKMISSLRGIIQGVDPNVLIDDSKTLDIQIDEDLATDRLLATLSTFFSALATLLASIGLYGVMAYSVARRTHDIGIRMALGAERSHVLWLVLRQALLLVAAGIVAGVPITWALGRLVSSLLYGLSPTDPLTVSVAGVVMFAVAAIASYLPARRASRLDPIVALHYE